MSQSSKNTEEKQIDSKLTKKNINIDIVNITRVKDISASSNNIVNKYNNKLSDIEMDYKNNIKNIEQDYIREKIKTLLSINNELKNINNYLVNDINNNEFRKIFDANNSNIDANEVVINDLASKIPSIKEEDIDEAFIKSSETEYVKGYNNKFYIKTL